MAYLTFYCLTSNKSNEVESLYVDNDTLFLKRINDTSCISLTPESIGERKFSFKTYKYIKKVTIPRKSILVIDNIDTLKKYYKYFLDPLLYIPVDMDALWEDTGFSSIIAYTLYDAIDSNKFPNYSPVCLLSSLAQVSYHKMLVSSTNGSKRLTWTSAEKCASRTKESCLKSDTCAWNKQQHVHAASKCSVYRSFHKVEYKDMVKVLQPYKYYIFSPFEMDIKNFKQPRSQPTNNHKPDGLWFGLGSAWIEFIMKENFYFKLHTYRYLYEIDVDLDKVMYIDTYQKWKEFSKQFRTKASQPNFFNIQSYVNWEKAIKESNLSGIIIPTSFKQLYHTSDLRKRFTPEDYFMGADWYWTWDIASGVIWDAKGLKDLRLVYKRESGKWVSHKDLNKSRRKIDKA